MFTLYDVSIKSISSAKTAKEGYDMLLIEIFKDHVLNRKSLKDYVEIGRAHV